MKAVETISKLYPNSKNHAIYEVYQKNEGWTKLWGANMPNIQNVDLTRLQNQGYTNICVYLVNQYGQDVKTDYKITELI